MIVNETKIGLAVEALPDHVKATGRTHLARVLHYLLRDASPLVREGVVNALGKLKQYGALKVIAETDTHPGVCDAADDILDARAASCVREADATVRDSDTESHAGGMSK